LNSFLQSFKLPPMDLELGANEIHIWLAVLEQPVSILHGFIHALSIEERIKAENFYFERDRNSFIVRRGILRTIIGRYLDVEPNRILFRFGKNGKPALDNTFDSETIHFNLSHSHGVALFAFSRNHEIGVDIEYMCDISEMDKIVESFFSIEESEVFRSLSESKKKEAFFYCWTCKEAFIKALGEGMSLPLDRFEVSLVPSEPFKLLNIDGDSRKATRWTIREIKAAPNYAGAFAVKSDAFESMHWRWDSA
jgi:4'-phosphopantetheinyl transferase